MGIRHAYIKRGTPQLNGKVERSHRSDGQEFYQLLSYKGDVDLEAKLNEWENFYNFYRPRTAPSMGKPPMKPSEKSYNQTSSMSRQSPNVTHCIRINLSFTTADIPASGSEFTL